MSIPLQKNPYHKACNNRVCSDIDIQGSQQHRGGYVWVCRVRCSALKQRFCPVYTDREIYMYHLIWMKINLDLKRYQCKVKYTVIQFVLKTVFSQFLVTFISIIWTFCCRKLSLSTHASLYSWLHPTEPLVRKIWGTNKTSARSLIDWTEQSLLPIRSCCKT